MPAAAQRVEEVLEFEELQPGCVAMSTVGDFGSGPVRVRGTSRRFGPGTNVAVVVDTERPNHETGLTTGDRHNALFISKIRPHKPAGAEAAWVAGSVGQIDDEDIPGATISFDFSEVGPITFYSLTLIDHDNHTAKIRLHRDPDGRELLPPLDPETRPHLTWGRKTFRTNPRRARLAMPGDDAPWLQIDVAPGPVSGTQEEIDLRRLRPADRQARVLLGRREILPEGVPGVFKVDVVLGGSSAIDRIAFRRELTGAPEVDADLFSMIERRISDSIRPELDRLRTDFETRWLEIAEQPPVLPADLELLTDDLEMRLLGTEVVQGLLECPDLPCGCPELRALRAWVGDRLATMRSLVQTAVPAAAAAAPPAREPVQIAALAAGRYLAGAGAIALAFNQGANRQDVDCNGTFFEQFFCDGLGLLNGVGSAIASLLRPSVRFEADEVLVAGVAHPCAEFRVAPMSNRYSHAETGILPNESRRLPRGLYCVRCRTPDGQLRPFATLDLVEGAEEGLVKDGGQPCTPVG